MGVSQFYFPLFEESLAAQNIPLEIKYLSVVESALNPRAVSRVGATGLWQFMYQTGKQYGLKVDTYEDEREEEKGRVWGDEVVEKKKINAGFQAYLDKKAGKKADKKEDKEEKGGKKAKPDFLDLDKDGNKKESMKKAAKDAKEDKKDDKKETKGLSKAQSKLPEGLRKAIEAKKK